MSMRPENNTECCIEMAFSLECLLVNKSNIASLSSKPEYWFEKEVYDDDDDYNNVSERLTYCPFCGRQL